MLDSISLKFSDSPLLNLPAKGVTLFVGPNNSGKSLVLRELDTALASAERIEHLKIIDDFEVCWPAIDTLITRINEFREKIEEGGRPDHISIARLSGNTQNHRIQIADLLHQVQNKNKHLVAAYFLQFLQIRLDGRTRFSLVEDKPLGDLTRRPNNVLAKLFQDDTLRKEIRNAIYRAFGLYFVLDPTSGGHIRIRLSATEPSDDEQSLNEAARKYHGAATLIKDVSDGLQAFVGILAAVRGGGYQSVLIDEPEAFLHPPLARKLGYELASGISKSNGSLIAATHSSDFLLGCLQGSRDVRVVRLEYSNGKSRGQFVEPDALRTFYKKPLVRSANVISSLFYDGVVVTESDNDRVFYSEIYHRLADQEINYPSILFVNAQNKQTIRDIVGPLRAFGVPAAALPDIDVLKDGGATWNGWLAAANIPSGFRETLGQARGNVHNSFTTNKIDMKVAGVEGLPAQEKASANQLFDTLAEYGIFATRTGEIESWLKHLGVPGKKTDWTIGMLGKLSLEIGDPSYVPTGQDDVWKFMRQVVDWIKDTRRKGTP